LTQKIKQNPHTRSEDLAKARDGKAWLALGYDHWQTYVTAEFGITRQRAHQLINKLPTWSLERRRETERIAERRREAERIVREWAEAFQNLWAGPFHYRDEVVRAASEVVLAAHEAGVSGTEIARLLHVDWLTIRHILERGAQMA
jgi:hypothetical protein